MSKINTTLYLIKRPKQFARVILEKGTGILQNSARNVQDILHQMFFCLENIFNIIFRRVDRIRLTKSKGALVLLSPYIGVPQMMAVTNYINCWLEGFRANGYDTLFVIPCQHEKPKSIPKNLRGSLLLAPFKNKKFSFKTILAQECPDFALFHNSVPSVKCAYSSSLEKSQRFLFVGDAMSRRFEDLSERQNYIDKVIDGFGGIVAVSDYILHEWCSYGFDPERIFVARTPVNAKLWPKYRGSSLQAEAGYFGNIYHKEIDNLLEISKLVVRVVPNFKLFIFGDGYPEDRDKLQKKIFEANLSQVVCLKESVSIEKMRAIQSKLDVLLLPREKGEFSDAGFPNKIGEYLASGCPTVCTDVGEISRTLIPGEHIRMVPPGDNRLFAKEVIECLNNRKESLEIAQCGREFIQAYASPEIVAKAFLEWRENTAQYAKI